jgi:hypothetical protein
MFCSAILHSRYWAGNFLANHSACVEFFTSASRPTTRLSASPSATSAAPYALRGAIGLPAAKSLSSPTIARPSANEDLILIGFFRGDGRGFGGDGADLQFSPFDLVIGDAQVFGGADPVRPGFPAACPSSRACRACPCPARRGAPALDGAGDDRQRALAVLNDVQFAEGLVDFMRIVPVDDADDEAEGLELFSANPCKLCCGETQSLWASSLQLKMGMTLVRA